MVTRCPEKTWSGSITYKPESPIELKLIDAHELPENVEVLHGLVWEKPGFVTLLSNRCFGESFVSSKGWSWINKKYLVQYALLGQWIDTKESLTTKLEYVYVTFSSLCGWMWMDAPFHHEMDGQEIKLSYKQNRDLCNIHIPAIKTNLTFIEGIGGPIDVSGVELTHDCSIKIQSQKPQALDWFSDQIYMIRNLLAFLSGLPIEPNSITAAIKVVKDDDNTRTELIDVYRSVRQVDQNETLNYKMTIPYTLLEKLTERVFQRWFQLNENALVPYRLCFDVIYNTHRFREFEFLALVQALESYHQYHTNNYDTRTDLIYRLNDLYKCLPLEFQDYLQMDEYFLNRVKDTRHYYTHYNPSKREKAYKDFELYKVVARLIPFVAAMLYRELGIPDEKILEAFERVKYQGVWQRQIPSEQKMGFVSEALRKTT